MPAKTSKPINPWAAIDAIVFGNPEPTGPEWFTVQDYVARYGGSYSHTHRKLSSDKRFKSWKGVAKGTLCTTTKFSFK